MAPTEPVGAANDGSKRGAKQSPNSPGDGLGARLPVGVVALPGGPLSTSPQLLRLRDRGIAGARQLEGRMAHRQAFGALPPVGQLGLRSRAPCGAFG